MIRTIAGAVRALRREGFLNESVHPAEPPFWTISRDPQLAGDPSAHPVAEQVALDLVASGTVRSLGDEGTFVLTADPSGARPGSAASSRRSAEPLARR
jgi:hypothetical protein